MEDINEAQLVYATDITEEDFQRFRMFKLMLPTIVNDNDNLLNQDCRSRSDANVISDGRRTIVAALDLSQNDFDRWKKQMLSNK